MSIRRRRKPPESDAARKKATSAQAIADSVAHARDTWRRDAPARFRELLNAKAENTTRRKR